jgi:hypothetical protein
MIRDTYSHVEPSYVRFVVDKLKSGDLSKENSAQLPHSVNAFYESLHEHNSRISDRHDQLVFLTEWSLLQDAISIRSFASAFNYHENIVLDYIQNLSPYFSNYGGAYKLYHERFRAFNLQLSNSTLLSESNALLLHWLIIHGDSFEPTYKKEYVGIHYLFANKPKEASDHLRTFSNETIYSWWISNVNYLLDYLYTNPDDEHLTAVAELLRGVYDRRTNERGAKLLALNADRIHWNELESYFHGTKFTYNLAFALAEHHEKLPANWIDILLSQEHPLFYTFACTWKYLIWKDIKIEIERVSDVIKNVGSPYLRGILKEANGGRALLHLEKIPELLMDVDIWEFVNEERWEQDEIFKDEVFIANLSQISVTLLPDLRYITDEFRSLHSKIRLLEKDYDRISKLAMSKELAWILMAHPSWEVSAYGSELLKKQLNGHPEKVRGTLDWIRAKSNQQLVYSMAEFCFELLDQPDFFPEFISISESIIAHGTALMRGEYLSSLCNYLESTNNESLSNFIHQGIIDRFALIASDIWETQEFIRLLQIAESKFDQQYLTSLVNLHAILRDVPNCLSMDFNSLWVECEKSRKNKTH